MHMKSFFRDLQLKEVLCTRRHFFHEGNKAQNDRKCLNPSRPRDEKVGTSNGSVGGEGPAWAPLRDNYMLTNPKLKYWDKMQDTNTTDDFGRRSEQDSDDD
ncbi:hypothetical protein OROHE_026090 [Orobanche hederae]